MKNKIFEDKNDIYKAYKSVFWGMLVVCCLVAFLPDSALAALADGGERDSIIELQKDLLGGKWLIVAEIAACLVGIIGSLRTMTATPFASAMAIVAGVHYFSRHTSAAAGLLLS